MRMLVVVAGMVVMAGCGSVGEEIGDLRATNAVLDLATASLEDWGCGHAFTVGTEDQSVRLTIRAEGSDGPPSPGTVEVGGDTWRGELVTGQDLFAQWCDDVIEEGEPEVVEEERYPVRGTLTWETPGTGACDGPATGRLTDAVVDASGEIVPLPDLDLRNEFFGCFAG